MNLQCKCGWIGPEADCDVESYTEPYEFWGMRGTQRVDVSVCPDCGRDDLSEAEEVKDEEA